jgi:DNA polymerase III alpha subunit
MKTDMYGRQLLDESDLCQIYLSNPDKAIKNALIATDVSFASGLELNNLPLLVKYVEETVSVEEFDNLLQDNWYMPDEYKSLDIAKLVLDYCKTDSELQRVGDELIKFQERNMFPLLRYCKYLVDTMRKHNVVWGVGRGSSVASYVLYLIGIHKIDCLHYDISIDEFLK